MKSLELVRMKLQSSVIFEIIYCLEIPKEYIIRFKHSQIMARNICTLCMVAAVVFITKSGYYIFSKSGYYIFLTMNRVAA